jgi:thiol-disulfide isomerase/thioredoxin
MKKIRTAFFLTYLFLTATITYSQQSAPVANSNSAIITIKVDLADEQYANTSLDDILAKYKGNVIYLDFWASWCNPCRQEMPYSLELQKKYQGKNVVFLYMSTDKNAQAWEDMVAKLKLTGINYRASEAVLQQIYNQFNLQYIPRYVLIDKNGKVVNDNAKRPSDPAAVADINKLL